jgi:pimeloyl-ACP methyl ester carboxylesterase
MTSGNGFSDFFYPSRDGLRLHARIYGEAVAGRWPVICLAGLTRNAQDFHELALFLSQRTATPRQVICFDYRGRGGSQHDDDVANYTVAVEAEDVLEGLAGLSISEGCFIGTSRGGLIVHLIGAMRPALLKAIVLNDIGPAIEPAGMEHIRAYLDPAPVPKPFKAIVESLRAVHGADFPALDAGDWDAMALALYRDDGTGRFIPDFDAKLVQILAGLDLTKPLPALWPQFDALARVPMMVVRGENSRLLSAATVDEMARRHAALRVVTVRGQGHAPFLETGALPQTIAAFFDEAESGNQAEGGTAA